MKTIRCEVSGISWLCLAGDDDTKKKVKIKDASARKSTGTTTFHVPHSSQETQELIIPERPFYPTARVSKRSTAAAVPDRVHAPGLSACWMYQVSDAARWCVRTLERTRTCGRLRSRLPQNTSATTRTSSCELWACLHVNNPQHGRNTTVKDKSYVVSKQYEVLVWWYGHKRHNDDQEKNSRKIRYLVQKWSKSKSRLVGCASILVRGPQ